MLPELALQGFATALATATGAIAAWWRRGSEEEDKAVADAADLVLNALVDGDATQVVECRAGRNWRDDLTVAEAEELNRERELRRFGWRRN